MPGPAVCSPILWKWYEKYQLAAKEFTDTKLLAIFMGGPFLLHTAKPARTLDEIRTLKIRAAGSSLPAAKALGMTPVTLPRPRRTRRRSGVRSTGRCFRGRR